MMTAFRKHAMSLIVMLALGICGLLWWVDRPHGSRPATTPPSPAQPFAVPPSAGGRTTTPSATPIPADTLPGKPAHPQRPEPVGQGGPVAPVFQVYDLRIVAAVAEFADANGLPPQWLLAMGAHEGGLGCWPAIGALACPTGDLNLDPRGSCGTFQIYVAVHGRDCAYWQDPSNAMPLMVARWRGAFVAAGGWNVWLQDPHNFLRVSIPPAQGSIAWTQTMAQDAYRVAWVAYIDLLQARARQQTPVTVYDRTLVDALTATGEGLDERIAELRALVIKLDMMRASAGAAVERAR